METFFGYLKTIRQYYGTAKGRHDILDYLGAFVLILLTIAVAYFSGAYILCCL